MWFCKLETSYNIVANFWLSLFSIRTDTVHTNWQGGIFHWVGVYNRNEQADN